MKYADLKELIDKRKSYMFILLLFLGLYLQSLIVGFLAFVWVAATADEDKCEVCDLIKKHTDFIKD